LGDFERRVPAALPAFPSYFSRLIHRDPWHSDAGGRIEQQGPSVCLRFGHQAAVVHAKSKLLDWAGYRAQQLAKRAHSRNTSDWRLCLAIDKVFSAHALYGQSTHHKAARHPDEDLQSNDQRQPFVHAAGCQMHSGTKGSHENLTSCCRGLLKWWPG
jgi:hypothetical protein